MISLVLLAVLVAAIAVRGIWARVVEKAVARRLPVGADGIVAGAQAIELSQPPSPDAVLLLHGFGDTPQTLQKLADALRARGFAVYAPLLPGHGRTLRDFRASGRAQWLGAAREALASALAHHERVGVAGLSMGGALAVVLAAESRAVVALALLAPYLEPPGSVRMFARASTGIGSVVPYLAGRSGRSIHDPVERARALAYRAAPPRLVGELVALADQAREDLGRIRAPTLYIQSREDNRLTQDGAMRAFAALGTAGDAKVLEWLSGTGHVITVDYGWEHVVERVGDWMERYVRVDAGTTS